MSVSSSAQAQLQQHFDLRLLIADDSERNEAATALASLPDRSVVAREEALLPPSFVPHTIRCLADAIVAVRSASELMKADSTLEEPPMSGQQPTFENTAATAVSSAECVGQHPAGGNNSAAEVLARGAGDQTVAFAGDVVGRLCRRGHAALVASSLWQLLSSSSQQAAAASGVVAAAESTQNIADEGRVHAAHELIIAVRDRLAMDKLLEALLRCLCSPRYASIVSTCLCGDRSYDQLSV